MSAKGARRFLERIILTGVDWRMRLLLFLFVILQVFDVLFTHMVVSRGGIELNPLAVWLVGYGLLPMVIFKISLVIFVAWVIAYLYPRCTQVQKYAVLGVYTSLVLWYVVIEVWNFIQAF